MLLLRKRVGEQDYLTLCLKAATLVACRYFLHTLFSKLTFKKNHFRNTIRVSNCLDPDQDRILLVLIWVQTIGKDYQQRTKVEASKERVKLIHSVVWSKNSVDPAQLASDEAS